MAWCLHNEQRLCLVSGLVIICYYYDQYEVNHLYKNLFLFFLMFIFERERQRAGGEGQREKETQNPKEAPRSEVSAQILTGGWNSQTVRS